MLTSSLIASRQPDRSAPYPSLPIFTSNKISRRPSSFHSASYKMLFQQPLCFENDPSFMGGVYQGVYPPPFFVTSFLSSFTNNCKLTTVNCISPRPVDRRAIAGHNFMLMASTGVAVISEEGE